MWRDYLFSIHFNKVLSASVLFFFVLFFFLENHMYQAGSQDGRIIGKRDSFALKIYYDYSMLERLAV